MKNLLSELSKELQSKLEDFVVSGIYIADEEVSVFSEYPINESFYKAIEDELINLYYKISR